MVATNAFGFNGFIWPTECPTIKIKYPWSIALHWPRELYVSVCHQCSIPLVTFQQQMYKTVRVVKTSK